MEKRKKILVPILNRAHYGRLRTVLKAVRNHPKLELQLLVGLPNAYGSLIETIRYSRPYSWRLAIPWYLRAQFIKLKSLFNPEALNHDFLVRHVRSEGFQIDATVPLFLDGGAPETMANVVGLGIPKIVRVLKKLKPDVVFINADRFEMMAIAIAAAYLNIPIAHNEGGDITGTIDESVRHAITKFAHYHFTSTEKSRDRVVRIGEHPNYVFAVGSPSIDVVNNLDRKLPEDLILGIDLQKPYLMVLLHPVATESREENLKLVRSTIEALKTLRLPTIFLGSNMDAGSNVVGEVAREWRGKENPANVYFTKSLPPDDFYRVLAGTVCAIGNSSSFIREAAFFGTPVVLVGSRQSKRERGMNTKDVAPDAESVKQAVESQIQHGRFAPDYLFGRGDAGEKIAELLAKLNPPIQKNFYE